MKFVNDLSQRAASRLTGMNLKHVRNLLEAGVLKTDGSTLRPKITQESLNALVLGQHYIHCRECGAMVSQITPRHLTYCSNSTLETYKVRFPADPIMCAFTKENRVKSEKEREHQSLILKRRFCTPEGEITRKQISEAAKKAMDNGYKERASEHLRKLNSTPEQREFLRILTSERWKEGGDLREKGPAWHIKNKKESNRLAAYARSHRQKVSKIHLALKMAMDESGIEGFLTEYELEFYAIDEANPSLKIAVEVDGCYWHSCQECGLTGPSVNKGLDKRKNTYLKNRGWVVLRFWGHDIRNRLDWCVKQIKDVVGERNA